jgi:hypothetical protein
MGYSKFIQELARGIEGKIAAYSHRDNQEGCLIYLRNLEQRIFVPAELIEHRRDEVIQILRQKIREGIKGTSVLILIDDGDGLVFEPEKPPARNREACSGLCLH